jgi:hypothetical protein
MLIVSQMLLRFFKKQNLNNEDFKETRQTGTISWAVYGLYFNSVCGLFVPIAIIGIFIATQVLVMTADFCALAWYVRLGNAKNIKKLIRSVMFVCLFCKIKKGIRQRLFQFLIEHS